MSNRTGTVVALTSAFLFNGRTLNGVEFGVLANVLGDQFATKVGTAPRPEGQRGKPATLWELSPNTPIAVTEIDDSPAVVADSVAESDDTAAENEQVEESRQNDESADPINVDDTEL